MKIKVGNIEMKNYRRSGGRWIVGRRIKVKKGKRKRRVNCGGEEKVRLVTNVVKSHCPGGFVPTSLCLSL